jgi:hypothetical protein
MAKTKQAIPRQRAPAYGKKGVGRLKDSHLAEEESGLIEGESSGGFGERVDARLLGEAEGRGIRDQDDVLRVPSSQDLVGEVALELRGERVPGAELHIGVGADHRKSPFARSIRNRRSRSRRSRRSRRGRRRRREGLAMAASPGAVQSLRWAAQSNARHSRL